eukprot:267571-Pelagomonas_calceolata.AAC.1
MVGPDRVSQERTVYHVICSADGRLRRNTLRKNASVLPALAQGMERIPEGAIGLPSGSLSDPRGCR